MRLLGIAAAIAGFMSFNANAAVLDTFSIDLNGTVGNTTDFLETFTVAEAFSLKFSAAPGVSGGSGSALRAGLRQGDATSPGASLLASGFTARGCGNVNTISGGNCFNIRTGSQGANLNPGEVLFGVLAAGTYSFGLNFDGNPTVGTLEFQISSIPVPAAGVLFGSALLGAAVVRRRKLQKALGLPG